MRPTLKRKAAPAVTTAEAREFAEAASGRPSLKGRAPKKMSEEEQRESNVRNSAAIQGKPLGMRRVLDGYRETAGSSGTMYTGDEVERTVFFGRATLFIVGEQRPEVILEAARKAYVYTKKVSHIYLAARNSYVSDLCNYFVWQANEMLDKGYCVTLCVPWEYRADVANIELLDRENFCLVLSMDADKMPECLGNGNTALRFVSPDSKTKGQENGAHVIALSTITDRYTPAAWYKKDVPVK